MARSRRQVGRRGKRGNSGGRSNPRAAGGRKRAGPARGARRTASQAEKATTRIGSEMEEGRQTVKARAKPHTGEPVMAGGRACGAWRKIEKEEGPQPGDGGPSQQAERMEGLRQLKYEENDRRERVDFGKAPGGEGAAANPKEMRCERPRRRKRMSEPAESAVKRGDLRAKKSRG